VLLPPHAAISTMLIITAHNTIPFFIVIIASSSNDFRPFHNRSTRIIKSNSGVIQGKITRPGIYFGNNL
jgi:hypothetical protein